MIFSVIAFVVSFALFKIFHVNFGEAGGIIAGSLTQSAGIGTANSAIEALHISQAAKTAAMSQVAIAYALTYVFGTIGVLIFLKNIAPAIFHVNLREATKEYIETNHIKTDTKSVKISANIRVRAFRINAENRYIGKTILDFNNDNVGLNIEEIVRDGKTLTSPSTVLANNDIILVIGSIKKIR